MNSEGFIVTWILLIAAVAAGALIALIDWIDGPEK